LKKNYIIRAKKTQPFDSRVESRGRERAFLLKTRTP
jgi:hypothetical protein